MPSVEELKDPAEHRHAQEVVWRAIARSVHYTRIQGLLHGHKFRKTGFDFISVSGLQDECFRLETPSLIVERKLDGPISGYLSVTAKRK